MCVGVNVIMENDYGTLENVKSGVLSICDY